MSTLKKLSASTIKTLVKDPYKFLNKFTFWLDLDEYWIWFTVGRCLHKVCEIYTTTWEYQPWAAFDMMAEELESMKLIDENWEEIYPFSDSELEIAVEQLEYGAKNVKWCLMRWWESETKIDTDDFTWFIDLIHEWSIYDYKFVKSFNSKWMYDSIAEYLIQWALYCKWYLDNRWELPKWCHFIEILKSDTLIKEVWYNKTVDLQQMIAEQYPDVDVDPKWKREYMVTNFKLNKKQYQFISFPVNDSFIQFWTDILSMALKLRWLMYDVKKVQLSLDKKATETLVNKKVKMNNEIKIVLKKFRELINQRVSLYYNSLTDEWGDDLF